jgi:hypothetical protein
VAVAALIGALAGLLASSGEPEPGRGARTERPAEAARRDGSRAERGGGGRPQAAGARGAALKPVIPGRPGSGTAKVSGRGRDARLVVEVSGLPPLEEQYAVWLYNSVSDARRLAGVVGGRFEVAAPLPAERARYRAIDVSREPLDGNSNHSGESVLRVPLARVLRSSG